MSEHEITYEPPCLFCGQGTIFDHDLRRSLNGRVRIFLCRVWCYSCDAGGPHEVSDTSDVEAEKKALDRYQGRLISEDAT